jgi:leucyl-tRNA synthetase
LREKRLFERTLKAIREEGWEEGEGRASYKELEYFLSQVVYRVTRDLKDRYHFNTAISSLMELVNLWGKVMDTVPPRFSGERKILLSLLLTFPRLLSPFAPHIAEEEWERLKGLDPLVDLYPFVSLASWPTYDEKKWLDREIEIPVQVNGKLRSRLKVPRGLREEDLVRLAQEDKKISSYLQEKEIVRVVVVPDKLINFVVK